MGWQRATGYSKTSHAETAVARYKHLVGSKLRARGLPSRQSEADIAFKMIRTTKPITVRLA